MLALLLSLAPAGACPPVAPGREPAQAHGPGLWIGGVQFVPADIAEAAMARNGDLDAPALKLVFSPGGRAKFARAQACRLHRRLEFWFDDTLVTAPIVEEYIRGGEALLSGPDNAALARIAARFARPH